MGDDLIDPLFMPGFSMARFPPIESRETGVRLVLSPAPFHRVLPFDGLPLIVVVIRIVRPPLPVQIP
ncbi:MAG: hypothetical protein M1493_04420 [Firmicutes bacterium]|nr:hypothetical protein [Bacillota bacterium]